MDKRVSLMTALWDALSPEDQVAATGIAHDDGITIAREFYGPGGSRRNDDRTVGYADYYAAYLAGADNATRLSWQLRTIREVCNDPRVFSFVNALERERRRLVGDTPVGLDLELLARACEITNALAEEISTNVWAEAQLSEMMLRAAEHRHALDQTLAHL
jgi:hypothetical protein